MKKHVLLDASGKIIASFSTLARYENLQRDFETTVAKQRPDYGFVALAIGRWRSFSDFPSDPPTWALGACTTLYEASETAVRPVVGPARGPQAVTGDEHILTAIADFIVDPVRQKLAGFTKEPSPRALIRHLLGKQKGDEDDANVRRLQRLWSFDREHQMPRAKLRLLQSKRDIPVKD